MSDKGVPAPPTRTDADPAAPFTARVAAFESTLLAEALAACHFNQRQAATRLGLSYHQFRAELKKHGLLIPRAAAEGAGSPQRAPTSAAG